MSKISTALILRLFFIINIIFFLTTLKFTLGLTAFSAIFNVFLVVLALTAILNGLTYSKFDSKSALYLILTVSLCFSCFVNLFTNWSFLALIQVITYLVSWLALIMVVVNQETAIKNLRYYWNWFNGFVVIICFVGLIEYLAVYAVGYRPPVMILDTGMGSYYVGFTTMLQKIPGLDVPYFRFQGPFGESGDLGMWASVLFIYNLLRQKYVYAFILSIAILGAFSPSIVIGLLLAFLIYIWTRSIGSSFLLILLSCLIIGIFLVDIVDIYTETIYAKRFSLGERLRANVIFLERLPMLLSGYPFGIPFFESSAEKMASGLGSTAVYGPIGSYEVGGIVASVVYIIFAFYGAFVSAYNILISKASMLENELYVYYLMLFTYIVQRSTLFDIAIFPFLFAPFFFKSKRTKDVLGFFKKQRVIRNLS